MKKKLFSLPDYSSLAAAFLFTSSSAVTQVLYTDLEPDIELELNYESIGIDLDDNGDFDFFFLKTSGEYSFWNGSFSVTRSCQALQVGPYMSQNAIVGYYISAGSEGGVGTYRPSALEIGDLINSNRSFQNDEFQILAFDFYAFYSPEGTFHAGGGNWEDELEGIEDGYIGVRFIDDDDCLHYGWIRCTTSDSCKSIIIKDYAYNEVPLAGLYAGELISAVEETNSLNATVYSYNNLVYINLSELMNDVTINIYDLSGKVIYSDKIINQFTQIKLNESKRMYIVKLTSGENDLVKKIYIN